MVKGWRDRALEGIAPMICPSPKGCAGLPLVPPGDQVLNSHVPLEKLSGLQEVPIQKCILQQVPCHQGDQPRETESPSRDRN